METLIAIIAEANSFISNIVWGWPAIILILGTGLWLTARTGFVQIRRFGHAIKHSIGTAMKREKTGKGEISPFQALATALAATVGTGNIAGVAGAIALGGPGAIFWMWVSALLGMATKFAEVVLAIRYRQRNEQGDWVGGPMYYIRNGLGEKWKWMGGLFCVLGVLASFGIGNMTQVNSIAENVCNAVVLFTPDASINITRIIIGVVVAILVAFIALGGVKRIGQVTELCVPVMSILYIVASLVVIGMNFSRLDDVLLMIVKGAFNPSAVVGGAVGVTFTIALQKGIARGIFSNEAGLGSAPIAHAASAEHDPVKQGFYGIFEVFMDTGVICTLTALTILCSGIVVPYGTSVGATLSTLAFSTVFDPTIATVVVAIALSLFAFTTIISWNLYGTRCCEYLWGSKAATVYKVLFLPVLIVGATMDLDLVWSIAETLNGMMAIPNLVALLALSGVVAKEVRRYFSSPERKLR